MAQYTVEGIVLGVKNWGEADKLVWFLSREQGKLRVAAYGARRARNPLAGALQPFNLLSLTLAGGERIDTARQSQVLHRFKKPCEDLTVMAYASFVAELALELFAEHEPQPELYDELLRVFGAFEERNPRLVALSAAFKLLQGSGLALSTESCVHCGAAIEGDAFIDVREGGAICPSCAQESMEEYTAGTRRLIALLEKLNLASPPEFSVKGSELLAAERIMLCYLPEIMEKPLKSLEFINLL